jgi:hypothetical protein
MIGGRIIGIHWSILYIVGFMMWGCGQDDSAGSSSTLFTLMDPKMTGVDFTNEVTYTEEYNTYTYRNFYNGAGVGLGDFNLDGLTDIYFCGNIVNNRLYLNLGNFRFEDISDQAGVACPDVWCTGVSIADVNGDGWPDIYVCKSGDPRAPNRNNELFINNGDLTFTEKASEYGIADLGLSTHATFFDYDRDGDLDCYLLNNSFQSVTDFDMVEGQRQVRDTLGGNKLYRNDGERFTDVSMQAGIYGSKIGFGLGVSVADLNRDGWMDLYVSNDFFERDYCYLNRGDGTFAELLDQQFTETSLGAMGADIADINNDAFPDIFVTEMTAQGNARLKTKVAFESWEEYKNKVDKGYHHQFARNVLQLNMRNGTFSEIGRFSGVDATDWSWGALIMDLDNDGWRDLFVANGIYKDLLDLDYLDLYSNPAVMRSMIQSEEDAILKLIDRIPSVRIPNYAFHNNGDFTFTNLADSWGLGIPSFSNGAAYGDLDNDGDLDLVVNNVNMPSFLYRNNSEKQKDSNFLSLSLKGAGLNTGAIGASVHIYHGGQTSYQELVPMRGFKSCVDHRLHFGLGASTLVDSLKVFWPDGTCSTLLSVEASQFIELHQEDAQPCSPLRQEARTYTFTETATPAGLSFSHVENNFSDFNRESLIFHMLSSEGPRMAVGDVNDDALDDLYICGARGSSGALYIQNNHGGFSGASQAVFERDKLSEETDCAFFDADGDGDLDLYVCHGGNEFPSSSSALSDVMYFNDGKGRFARSEQVLPAGRFESSACVKPSDFDGDGDMDLFVGIRLRPFLYGVPVNGYLLENDGMGDFSNCTDSRAPQLKEVGMVTDMTWVDLDRDGDPDMVVVGDWMPVKFFLNEGGNFTDRSEEYGLGGTEGLWRRVLARDLDGDGQTDLILGNQGLNSRLRATAGKPLTMYVNDFDLNGSVEQIICAFNGDTSYPVVMKNDLVKQIPALDRKYPSHASYSHETIDDIFSTEILERSVILQASVLESCVIMNTGTGPVTLESLPIEAQFSPLYALAAEDFNMDGSPDLLLGGNLSRAKPETGIYKGSYGVYMEAMAKGRWKVVPADSSGFSVRGDIRDIKILRVAGKRVVAIARNNDILHFYTF